MGPNPTAVPASHRCRVTRFKTFAWKITCEVPGCGYIRINGDWYMAMGDARQHFADAGLRRQNGVRHFTVYAEET